MCDAEGLGLLTVSRGAGRGSRLVLQLTPAGAEAAAAKLKKRKR